MFSSLIAGFFVATKIAASVTAIGLVAMSVNAIDAIYGDRIEKFLSDTENGTRRDNARRKNKQEG